MYRIGSIIEYQTFTGAARIVLVEEKDDDIKNGRAGFGGILEPSHMKNAELRAERPGISKLENRPRKFENGVAEGAGVWGYDSQITKVLKY